MGDRGGIFSWAQLRALCRALWKEEGRRNRLLVLLGLVGLGLILLSELLPAPKAEAPATGYAQQLLENEAYVTALEKKLDALVEEVSGAGRCQVMITLEQGAQYVFASESKKTLDESESRQGEESSKIQQKDNRESKIVVLEENGVSRPLVETSREPQVKGVVVVCDGGSSSIVQQRITQVLTTVLGIGANQVCVVPRK